MQSVLHFEQSSAIIHNMHNLHNMIDVLKETFALFIMKYNPKARSGTAFVTDISAARNQIKKENVYYEPSETYG